METTKRLKHQPTIDFLTRERDHFNNGYFDNGKVPTESMYMAWGFITAIRWFGIYKDGSQTIGCMEYSVKEIEDDIKKAFGLGRSDLYE